MSRLLCRNVGWILVLIIITVAIGMIGFMHFGKQTWIRAYMNSAMILSNVGDIDEVLTDAHALFIGTYALFCGCVIYFILGLMVAPLVAFAARRTRDFEVLC